MGNLEKGPEYEAPQVEEIEAEGMPVEVVAGVQGSPSPVSDRNLKRDFEPVDTADVLERVAALPIETWSYKANLPEVRHMGPMAQDFAAAFGLGDDDRHIHVVDSAGVALAAIQGLHEVVERQAAEIAELRAEVERLAGTREEVAL